MTVLWAEKPKITNLSLALRHYQQEAIDAIYDPEPAGVKRQLVAMPTGTGKPVVFSQLLAERHGRSLVLGHRDELIRQAVEKITIMGAGLNVGVIKAAENDVAAQVIVASVQTLARENRLEQLPQDITTVIVDEAHHATADPYKYVLEHVGAFDPDGPLTVGFTATPERGDHAGLGKVWQEIVYQKPLLEMILAGYLADLRAVRVSLVLNLDLHTRGGDIIDSELEGAMELANAPGHVLEARSRSNSSDAAIAETTHAMVCHNLINGLMLRIPTQQIEVKGFFLPVPSARERARC